MFTLLAVILQEIAEDDKHLIIISGLRAIKKKFLLKYVSRCDRRIIKLWRKISSLKRDCNQIYRLLFPLDSKFSPSYLVPLRLNVEKSSLHVHPCQGCAFKMQIFCFSRDGSTKLKVAKTKLWRELQDYQPIWIWSLCPCLISEILVWSINRIIIWQCSPGPYCDWFLIGRDFAIQNGHKPCIYILENRQNPNL